MKAVYIMHGLPGSGKSYLANQIKEKYETKGIYCPIFSTDDFWYVSEEKPYDFNLARIGKAHRWNQDRCYQAIEAGVQAIIVDNTNTTWKEIKPYAKMAVDNGYDVKIEEPDTKWSKNVEECFKRNTHNVPKEVIQKMLDRFQDRVIIEFEIRQLELNKRMSQ